MRQETCTLRYSSHTSPHEEHYIVDDQHCVHV